MKQSGLGVSKSINKLQPKPFFYFLMMPLYIRCHDLLEAQSKLKIKEKGVSSLRGLLQSRFKLPLDVKCYDDGERTEVG